MNIRVTRPRVTQHGVPAGDVFGLSCFRFSVVSRLHDASISSPYSCPLIPDSPASFGPVEMCELSEVSELSPQDAVESLSVKGAMGGVGLFF